MRDLSASFFTRRGEVRAVRDVSFSLRQGETLALVGESGSGKTATAMSILRMLPGTGRITSGEIVFQGEDLLGLSRTQDGEDPRPPDRAHPAGPGRVAEPADDRRAST